VIPRLNASCVDHQDDITKTCAARAWVSLPIVPQAPWCAAVGDVRLLTGVAPRTRTVVAYSGAANCSALGAAEPRRIPHSSNLGRANPNDVPGFVVRDPN
jgi:hypothetical protein